MHPFSFLLMLSRTRLACVVTSVVMVGCGPSSERQPAIEREVLLGTGERSFEAIRGEPELELVAGVQGGFHIWASFLAYDFASQELAMVLVTSIEGEPESRLVMRSTLTTAETLDAAGNPAFSFAGFPAQVRNARCAHGKRVRMELELSDGAGNTGADVRHCIAQLEESRRSTDCD